MTCLLGLFLVLAAPTPGQLETLGDVFVGSEGGYAVYRIPGLVVTAKGTLIAYCEGRRTGRSDWGAIDILLKRSTDSGKTWSAARVITVPGSHTKNPVALKRKLAKPTEITFNNPVAIADPARGTVHFLFCLEYMRCFYCRSHDDGETFSNPVEMTRTFDAFRPEYPWAVLATGPGHGIRLQNGRLLVPVWLSRGTSGNAHSPSCVATIYSDDDGDTWKRGAIVANEVVPLRDPNETAAVELADGRVMLNIRSPSPTARRAISFSRDGVKDWSKPTLVDDLYEPVCMAGLARVPGENGGLVFTNPQPLAREPEAGGPGQPRQRINLTAHFSRDEGQTWPVKRVVDAGPAGYSDLAITSPEAIYCFYERGAGDGKTTLTPRSLRLIRFDQAWLQAKKK